MAKQEGVTQIKGTIGNLSFYKSQDGDLVRQKGGIDGDKIQNEEGFARNREHLEEFGAAGKAGKLIRASISDITKGCTDSKMASRLVKQIMYIVKNDAINDRGKRNVMDGPAHLLRGFEFNAKSPLDTTLRVQLSTTINRDTGELSIQIPSFNPDVLLSAPKEATHFRLFSAAMEINFQGAFGSFVTNLNKSADIFLGPNPTPEIVLTHTLPPDSDHVLFLILGVQFYQRILNGKMYPLNNRAYNALKILDVNKKAA